MRKILPFLLVVALASCGSQTVKKDGMLTVKWQYDGFEDPLSVGVRPSTSGYIMAVSVSGNEYTLIDESTGQTEWVRTVEEEIGSDNAFPPVEADGRMVFSCGNQLRCMDIRTGDQLWSVATRDTDIGPASFSQPAFSNGRIFVGTASGSLLCLDAPSGVQNWEIKSSVDAYGPVVAMGNKIVANMLSGRIECRKQDQGWVVWKNDHFSLPMEPIPNDGETLYLSNPGPSIASLDINDMKVLWTKSIANKSGTLQFNPEITGDLLFCCDENTVYGFDRVTGDEKFKFEIPFDPTHFKALSDRLLITSKNRLYCYSFEGKLLGEFKEPNGDGIFGIDEGKTTIICWSARTIYGLSK